MEINLTLFIQLAIYVFLILVLKKTFFEPILKILKRREQLTVGAVEEAGSLETETLELQKRYEVELNRSKDSMESHRSEQIKALRERLQKQTDAAKTKLEARMNEEQTALHKEMGQLQSKLSEWSDGISKEIVRAVMSSKVVEI